MVRFEFLVILTFTALRVYGSYDVSDRLLFPLLPNGAPRSTNNQCREESQLYISHLNNMSLWAHKMWDASAKSSTGTLQGNTFQMGDWDECMKTDGPFKTQFCLVTLKASVPPPNPARDPFSLRYNPMENVMRRIYKHDDHSQIARDMNHFGWCVPASCSPIDLENSLSVYFDKLEHPLKTLNVNYSVNVSPDFCQTEKEIENFGIEDIVFCLLVAIFFVVCIIGTVYDMRQLEPKDLKKPKKPSLSARIILAFSLRKNFNGLSRADDSNEALKILYGLRTFSIFMIITDHRFGTFLTTPLMNYDFIEMEYRGVATWFIFHGDLFVDTFFVLSGILVTYSLLTQFDKKVLHPAYIIFLRYMRLTPLYAFVVFYYASMFNHTGFGPIWKIVVPKESADCKANWWTNLLYISNYVNDRHMCMTHSWYLPCDFHYFIVAIFICLWLRKDKRKALAGLAVLFVISIIVPMVITIVYLRPALLHFYPDFLLSPKTHDDFVLTYTKTHTRASSYIIGMFAGYFYYKMKDKEYHFTKMTSHIITLVSLIFLFGGMASGAIFYNPYHDYNPYEAAAYAGLHRPAWAIGTVGLLLVASYGHATLLRVVLSWSPWVPLSKLVYGAYLIHMSYQVRYVGASKNVRFFDYFEVICLAIGDISISFITALIMFLGIEAPIRKIFRELTSKPPRKQQQQHQSPMQSQDTINTEITTISSNCVSRL